MPNILHCSPETSFLEEDGKIKMKNPCLLCGLSLGDIQFRGRWESIATAKGYVDVVYAILPETLEQEDRVPEYEDSDFV